jgi:drug/metabolite transporter (DMT)-like permease
VRLTDLAGQALYQGVVTAVVSLALFGRSITLLGASKAAAFVALVPVIAALTAIPALGELPTSIDWLAIGMIAAGVYLASGAPMPGLSAEIRQANDRGYSVSNGYLRALKEPLQPKEGR